MRKEDRQDDVSNVDETSVTFKTNTAQAHVALSDEDSNEPRFLFTVEGDGGSTRRPYVQFSFEGLSINLEDSIEAGLGVLKVRKNF